MGCLVEVWTDYAFSGCQIEVAADWACGLTGFCGGVVQGCVCGAFAIGDPVCCVRLDCLVEIVEGGIWWGFEIVVGGSKGRHIGDDG